MSKLSFNDSVRVVRNKLRKYSCVSVISRLIFLLDKSTDLDDKIESLKYFPWIVCLLIKIVFEDKLIYMKVGAECPQEVVDECVNIIWSAQSIDDFSPEDPGTLYRSLRSLLQGQLVFQNGVSWNFLRWPALIADLPKNHRCYVFFIDRFGVDPNRFMEILTLLYAPVINKKLLLEVQYFSPIINRIGSDFLRLSTSFQEIFIN